MLVEQIDTIADKMVRVQLSEWREYVSVINRLLSNPQSKKDVDQVIAYTLLPLLECG